MPSVHQKHANRTIFLTITTFEIVDFLEWPEKLHHSQIEKLVSTTERTLFFLPIESKDREDNRNQLKR